MRKLCELKVNEMEAKNVLSDLFGSQIDDTYFEGLIDSVDYKDFMEKVEMLRVKWIQCVQASPSCSVPHKQK